MAGRVNRSTEAVVARRSRGGAADRRIGWIAALIAVGVTTACTTADPPMETPGATNEQELYGLAERDPVIAVRKATGKLEYRALSADQFVGVQPCSGL